MTFYMPDEYVDHPAIAKVICLTLHSLSTLSSSKTNRHRSRIIIRTRISTYSALAQHLNHHFIYIYLVQLDRSNNKMEIETGKLREVGIIIIVVSSSIKNIPFSQLLPPMIHVIR